MDQELLKTSAKQRVIIAVIAVLMLGSIIASSVAMIVANGNQKNESSLDPETEALVAKYENEYYAKSNAVAAASEGYFNDFVNYKSEIKAFNEVSANEGGVETRDLKEGYGRTIGDDDTNYLAYYVGWCPNEDVFDSTFNDKNNPTSFNKILDPSIGLIEGWTLGVAGMKIGGIREITIPGELAYGGSTEICGGYNMPLKFMVMAVEKTSDLQRVSDELSLASTKIQYAYYGLDYDTMMGGDKSTEGAE